MSRLVNLDADYLLATILSDREAVPFQRLRFLQNEIEQTCPWAIVDLSSPSIVSAVQSYPAIFEWREKEIGKARTADRYLKSDYLTNVFTNTVPDNVHDLVQKAISKVLAPQ